MVTANLEPDIPQSRTWDSRLVKPVVTQRLLEWEMVVSPSAVLRQPQTLGPCQSLLPIVPLSVGGHITQEMSF